MFGHARPQLHSSKLINFFCRASQVRRYDRSQSGKADTLFDELVLQFCAQDQLEGNPAG